MSPTTGPGQQHQPWWNRWYSPYLVLLLVPVITLPVTFTIWESIPYCIIDEHQYKTRDVALALSPTVADLLPFLWFLSRAPGVRRAAIIAGLIGAARFAIPVVLLLAEVQEEEPRMLLAPPEPPGPCEDYPVSMFFFLGMIFFMPMLWAASAALAGLAALITRPNPPNHLPSRSS